MKDPREFTCFDDSPYNNGWGYNWDCEPQEDEEEKEEDYTNENLCQS